MPSANPEAMLFRYVGGGCLIYDGEEGESDTKCCEHGKVYSFDSEPPEVGQFKRVDEPPPCHATTPFSKLVETCDALIKWMNGPTARELDWDVSEDYKVKTPAGRLVRFVNRPVSASELVKRRIEWLYEAASLKLNPPRARLTEVDCLHEAVREVTRLRDLVKKAE